MNRAKSVDKDNPSVLLVDDEPLNLEALESFLHGTGYNIIKVSNGRDAFGADEHRPGE